MRRLALLVLVLAATSDAQRGGGRFDRVNSRCAQGRSDRGLPCGDDLAFFEFAPSGGQGMGAACACAAITGAKGEAVTFSRAGAATCSPLGLATTGITNASLVECSANLPRVESSGGVLGLRVEGPRTNVLTRFIDYANATWSDVATPTLTGAQVSPWTGTYANLAVQFDDNDAVAFEGRTQTVAVVAATQYVMSCLVKAGTLNTARLSLDGTTADFTGLSSTTWTLATVIDASSSGVAIAAQALNGSTAAATGTVIWGGCQVEAGSYATSPIPTVAAAVTRNDETGFTDLGVGLYGPSAATGGCAAVTAQCRNSTSGRYAAINSTGGTPVEWDLWFGATTTTQWAAPATTSFGSTLARDTAARRWAVRTGASGSQFTICRDGACESGSARGTDGANITNWRLFYGNYVSGSFHCDGIISRIQADPSLTRCSAQ